MTTIESEFFVCHCSMFCGHNLSTTPGLRAPWTASVQIPKYILCCHLSTVTTKCGNNWSTNENCISVIGVETRNSTSYIPFISAVVSNIYFIILFNFAGSYIVGFHLKLTSSFRLGLFTRNWHYDRPPPENNVSHTLSALPLQTFTLMKHPLICVML